ncbi:MAG: hypothetical protein QOE76_3215, partial [Frankiales bacterium]|nr:hypothetical protein [Frankiales bacterium]
MNDNREDLNSASDDLPVTPTQPSQENAMAEGPAYEG